MSVWEETLRSRLARLEQEGRLRSLVPVARAVYPVLERDGRSLINFSSNNYLGLANHPELMEAARKGAQRGAGATASRLIVGHDEETERLEQEIAAFKGTEAALVFGSGYTANMGVLSALLQRGDAVFSDKWNHASIVDGIRLSGATLFRYRHLDMDHLEAQLRLAEKKGIRRKLIVTDTVFSMDGDVARLHDLISLKERYDAALMVDEAHGGGVFGPYGEGVAHHMGLAGKVDLHMGTFSKAFGVVGAYVAGNRTWISYLVNTCRPFIYTTALPPAVIEMIRTSLRLVREAGSRRIALHRKAARFRNRLKALGLNVGPSETQIIPLIVGDVHATVKLSQSLMENGVLAVPIRPPTVPEGTARLRFSLMATHTEEHLETAIDAIERAVRTEGVTIHD
ncbi:putative 8-amino-7-oxononanoate synthase [Polycladomyces abyssicola]|uniref:8-amino-7-ketopelargonate synthase n=1 Tax=Polycladomyces abyssicola TaxID=1125966 RepID=A0A8D5UJR8_9BACL|nr:8-amino-7-oxononanoate synthase [Polycladomyces abyssicola]BCU83035.1 putative 8-amino-7-oxononanoate synthase [Polycladomyces abyssicola]